MVGGLPDRNLRSASQKSRGGGGGMVSVECSARRRPVVAAKADDATASEICVPLGRGSVTGGGIVCGAVVGRETSQNVADWDGVPRVAVSPAPPPPTAV